MLSGRKESRAGAGIVYLSWVAGEGPAEKEVSLTWCRHLRNRTPAEGMAVQRP